MRKGRDGETEKKLKKLKKKKKITRRKTTSERNKFLQVFESCK